MVIKKCLVVSCLFFVVLGFSQQKKGMNATMVAKASSVVEIEPLSLQKLIPAKPRNGKVNPKRSDGNKIIPGKGFPKNGDPLLVKQKNAQNFRTAKAASLIFEVASDASAPTDPTGAIGPNHYVSAKNSSFAIYDRAGTVLVPTASLANIFPGEDDGDPIVMYDSFADRFIITQFKGLFSNPDGLLIAISQGPDPVTSGWFTYEFILDSFPDYPKFSIWSDGYYVTANKNQFSQDTREVVFALERDKMLLGDTDARIIGFPLPGAEIGGFYSPASFNALGKTLPPPGDAKIIYFQDDAWAGVPDGEDALKLWTINVDWINPSNSTIVEAEELSVSPFDSTFDGGSFANLPQPGGSGEDIDVLQGTVMYATNYRRFCDYNAVVLNFSVDIDDRTDSDNISGIRWYELRQNGDGQPWTIYQEGTYTAPDGKSAWCGSMAMDIFGNIGMGYSTIGTIADGATADSFVSIRYTGRLADDPLGTMTFPEETIATGTEINETDQNRYGDYAHLSVDPIDNTTFWHVAEYFEATGDNARNVVGVFKIANDVANDVGVLSIDNPIDKILTNNEEIEITIQNFGTSSQSNIPVSYTINGVTVVNEIFPGPIDPGEMLSYVFATPADLSTERDFIITAQTNLATDTEPENDCTSIEISALLQNDVGVLALISPITGSGISSNEPISIRIQNFGEMPQSNIPVFYVLDSGSSVNEIYTETIEPGASAIYTFNTTADLLDFRTYTFEIGTTLTTDENINNDRITVEIEHQSCFPESNCNVGISSFELLDLSNSLINCGSGYEDFTNLVANLDGPFGLYNITVQSRTNLEDTEVQLSLWIDFNDNQIFEDSERLLSNEIIKQENTNQNFVFSLGNAVTTGRHLLRIRAGDTNENTKNDLNDPCKLIPFGTTHDYTVNIGNNQSPTSDLIVINRPNKQFLITMRDPDAQSQLKLNVYTITGKIIASNFVKKNTDGRFVYELDMSYASTGIYFVRLGDKNLKNRSAKFIVP